MTEWQVNEAKSRFSRLIQCAESDGPQVITKHGVESVVVLSIDDYRKLQASQLNFRDYLLSGPKVDEFQVERSDDAGREIDF